MYYGISIFVKITLISATLTYIITHIFGTPNMNNITREESNKMATLFNMNN